MSESNIPRPSSQDDPERLTVHNSYDILAEDPKAVELDALSVSALEAKIGLSLECQQALQPLVGLFDHTAPPATYSKRPRSFLRARKVLDTNVRPGKSWSQTDPAAGITRMFTTGVRNISADTTGVVSLRMNAINEGENPLHRYAPRIEVGFGDNVVDKVELVWCEGVEQSRAAISKLLGGTALEAFLEQVTPSTNFGLDSQEQFPIHKVLFDIKQARLIAETTGYGTLKDETTPPKIYGMPSQGGGYHVQLRPEYSFSEDGHMLVRGQEYQQVIEAVEEFSGTKFADRISPAEYLKALVSTVALLRSK